MSSLNALANGNVFANESSFWGKFDWIHKRKPSFGEWERKIEEKISHENHNYNELWLFAAWILITRIERRWVKNEKTQQNKERMKQKTMFTRDREKKIMTLSSWQLTNESANRKNTHTAQCLRHRESASEWAREREMTKQSVRAYKPMKHHPQLPYTDMLTYTLLGTLCPNRCLSVDSNCGSSNRSSRSSSMETHTSLCWTRTNGVSATTVREFCTVISLRCVYLCTFMCVCPCELALFQRVCVVVVYRVKMFM